MMLLGLFWGDRLLTESPLFCGAGSHGLGPALRHDGDTAVGLPRSGRPIAFPAIGLDWSSLPALPRSLFCRFTQVTPF